MKVQIRFENRPGAGLAREYVGVLADSDLSPGPLAAQNAGSSLASIYYQVGGGGLNGAFARALGAPLTAAVNARLVGEYDARYGAGSWAADRSAGVAGRLTSFLCPFDARQAADAGRSVSAMLYSVGPQLGPEGITDEPQYRQVYVDAFDAVAAANRAAPHARLEALRLTMVSTGIFGGGDRARLAATAARLILDGLEAAAAAADPADLPNLVLVNSRVAPDGTSKEIDAFRAAAEARGIDVRPDVGFELEVAGA